MSVAEPWKRLERRYQEQMSCLNGMPAGIKKNVNTATF